MLSGNVVADPALRIATGSERLDFVASQVWGCQIAQGGLRVISDQSSGSGHGSGSASGADGWEVRERYWAVPSAHSAQVLVPHARRAASAALSQYAGLRSVRTRVLRRMLAGAVSVGIAPSRHTVSVLARPGVEPTIVQVLGEATGRDRVVAALGVRAGANAKPTIELRTLSGESIGFAKLGWNAATRASVTNEARMLRRLTVAEGPAIRAPRVIADGEAQQRSFVITEPLPLSTANVPPTWSALSAGEVLGPGTVYARRPWQSIHHAIQLQESTTRADVAPHLLGEQVRDLLHAIYSRDVVVPIADLWHGDFVPWNVGRDADRQLWVFDWETAEPDVPAGLDTMHWLTHTQGRIDSASLVARVSAAALRAEQPLRSLGYSREARSALAAYYAAVLVQRARLLAASWGSWKRVQHQPPVLSALVRWGHEQLAVGTESRASS